ncbi:hypothetical protein BH23GEM6_BH23GEM6_15540 [soil metagenome]
MAEGISIRGERPPSEVEWEDLLLRLELMTRALRNALEDRDLLPVLDVLREMVGRERRVGNWLERHAIRTSGTGGTENAASLEDGTTWRDPAPLADRFVSLRARNLAMVQRRGLDVWDWHGSFGDEDQVSSFQLLSWLQTRDVEALARLRGDGGRRGAQAC